MSENPDVPAAEPIGRGRALVVMPTYNEAGNLASIVPVVLKKFGMSLRSTEASRTGTPFSSSLPSTEASTAVESETASTSAATASDWARMTVNQ